MTRMRIAQEYVDREHGDVIVAALAFAVDLMRGDRSQHKAGYSPDAAILATIEAFGFHDEQDEVVGEGYRSTIARLVAIADDLAGTRLEDALAEAVESRRRR